MKFQVQPTVSGADVADILIKSAVRESFAGRVGDALFAGMSPAQKVEAIKAQSDASVIVPHPSGHGVEAFDLRAVPSDDIELSLTPVADVNAVYAACWTQSSNDAMLNARLTNSEDDCSSDDTLHVLCSYHALAVAAMAVSRAQFGYRAGIAIDAAGVEQVFVRTHESVVQRWSRYAKFVEFVRAHGSTVALDAILDATLELSAVHKARADEIKARGRSALPTRRKFFVNHILKLAEVPASAKDSVHTDGSVLLQDRTNVLFSIVPTLAVAAANDLVTFVGNVADAGELAYVNVAFDPQDAIWPVANYITELALCLLTERN